MNKCKNADLKNAITNSNQQWVDKFIAHLNDAKKNENENDTVSVALDLRQLKRLIQDMIDNDRRMRGNGKSS